MARSEGEEVRLAYDGPSVEADDLLTHIEARNREDTMRSSSAGESRQKIGAFLEETGLNSKAYSWLRTILKQKTTDKQMDIIRSLEVALPIVKAHVAGGGTLEMFPDDDGAVDPVDEPIGHNRGPEWQPDDDAPVEDEDPGAEEIAEEADEFERALAETVEK